MCLCGCAAAQIKETARETYEGGRKFKGGGLKRDTPFDLKQVKPGFTTYESQGKFIVVLFNC